MSSRRGALDLPGLGEEKRRGEGKEKGDEKGIRGRVKRRRGKDKGIRGRVKGTERER